MKALEFSMPIIDVKNLSKRYEYYRKEPGVLGSVKSLFYRKPLYAEAVKGVSFSIEPGELVGFLGPNGAGKTTTLKMLSGILHPSSGEIQVLGHVPKRREPAYLKEFSLVMGQKNQLINDIPARESFLVNKEIYEVSDADYKKQMDELVELFELKDLLDISVRKLSLGQRMKCELTAALLHNPKVLLLDEPTIGLDVVAQKNIRDFIKRYNHEFGTTIMLTSHYMEDIKELCDRVIIINLGQIIYDGNLANLIRTHAPDKTLQIAFGSNGVVSEQVAKFGAVEEFSQFSCKLRVKREDAKKVAAAILASDLPVDDILINEVNIDDVIRTIFRP